MAGEIEARLKALDLVLPEVEAPIAYYVPIFTSTASCSCPASCPSRTARSPSPASSAPMSISSQGEEAARLCAINILAQAKAALRDLDRIVQLLRLNGFVNAAPDLPTIPRCSTAPPI